MIAPLLPPLTFALVATGVAWVLYGDTLGQNDFVQYWCAFREWQGGRSPYVPESMLACQSSLTPHHTSPLMMWNPPWVLLLLAPVLTIDSFASSALLWSFLQFFVLALVGDLVARHSNYCFATRIGCMALAVTFFPGAESVMLGQLGALLLVGALLFTHGVVHGKPLPLVTGALLLSVKPHLFFLFPTLLFLPQARAIVFSRTSVLLGLLGGATLISASGFTTVSAWFTAASAGVEGAIRPLQWVAPTLIGRLRLILASEGILPLWPAIILPGLTFVAVASWLVIYRPPLSLPLIWFLLALSHTFGPFGWVFDQTVLLVAALTIWTLPRGSRGYVLLLTLWALPWVYREQVSYHHEWWPLSAMLLLATLLLATRATSPRERAAERR